MKADLHALGEKHQFRKKVENHLSQLKLAGATIADYFQHKDIKDISLYTDSEFFPIILQNIGELVFALKIFFFPTRVFQNLCQAWG